MANFCDARYLAPIVGRMIAEDAKDFSSLEIERTLSPCVGGRKLVPAAKRLRDSGAIAEYMAEVYPNPLVPDANDVQTYEARARIYRLVNASKQFPFA